MAVQVASLEARLELDNRKFEKSLKSVDKDLSDFSKKDLPKLEAALEDVEDGLNDLGKTGGKALDDVADGAGKAGGGITKLVDAFNPTKAIIIGLTALAGAAVAVATAAIKASLEWDKAMGNMEARTGATGKELDMLGDTAKEVFSNNWGDSLSDAADAVVQVNQVLGETDEALEDSTRRALIFRDVFGIEVNESIRAVRSTVEGFGVDSQKAFDIMAKVIQEAGDPAQDLADTFNEYSIILGEAGFSAEEFGGLLIQGVEAGARNFDQVADALKEFTIRIKDGSDSTKKALAELFSGGQIEPLVLAFEDATGALEAHERAVEKAGDDWDKAGQRVDEWEKSLSDAKRTLEDLARPNLAGMEEFDDQIFQLELDAKRARLALIGMDEDSPEFDRARAGLESINDEIEKLNLQKDIKFLPMFKALERSVEDGTKEVIGFSDAMGRIRDQKEFIDFLEEGLGDAVIEATNMAMAYQHLESQTAQFEQGAEKAQEALNNALGLAEPFMAGLADGSISGRDALAQILPMLQAVEDEVLQNQLGVALFGTKWEDLKTAILALDLDKAVGIMGDFTGATNAAGDAVSSNLTAKLNQLWNQIQVALIPLGDIMLQVVEKGLPALEGLVGWMIATGIPKLEEFGTKAVEFITPFVDKLSEMDENSLAVKLGIEAITASLEVLGPAIGLTVAIIGGIITILEKADQVFQAIDEKVQALGFKFDSATLFITAMGDAVKATISFFNPFVGIADNINQMVTSVGKLTEKLNILGSIDLSGLGRRLPSFLRPGSPTPLEMGIRGIARSMEALPSIGDSFGAPATATVAGGGGGGGSININMGGNSFSFDNSPEGQNQALLTILQMLRSQLSLAN